MSRSKKSRKPAPLGSQKAPRLKKEDRNDQKDRKNKAPKGQKSGSRNNPIDKKSSTNAANKSTDPRHGSKKPISLNPVIEKPIVVPNFEPQVKLTKVKPEGISPEQELEQIENDERLMELLDRADAGEVLKGKDAKYFNAKTARHQELVELLGLDDEEDEDYEGYDEEDDDYDDAQTSSLVEQWEADDEDDLSDDLNDNLDDSQKGEQ